jgi:hypothetical protein
VCRRGRGIGVRDDSEVVFGFNQVAGAIGDDAKVGIRHHVPGIRRQYLLE